MKMPKAVFLEWPARNEVVSDPVIAWKARSDVNSYDFRCKVGMISLIEINFVV